MADDNPKIAKSLENLTQLMTTFSKVIVEQTKATQEQTAAFRDQSRKLDQVLDLRGRLKALEQEAEDRRIADARREGQNKFLTFFAAPVLAAIGAGIGYKILDVLSKAG